VSVHVRIAHGQLVSTLLVNGLSVYSVQVGFVLHQILPSAFCEVFCSSRRARPS